MKIKKSALTLALAAAVMLGIMVGAHAADTLEKITAHLNYGIQIKYNGEVQELKDSAGNRVYPISYEGTTYLPVRAIAGLLGVEVNWDGPTNTVWLGSGFEPTPTTSSTPETVEPAVQLISEKIKGFNVLDPYDYPKGKEFVVNGKTYVSDGFLMGNFVVCQPDADGIKIAVNPESGTTMPVNLADPTVYETGEGAQRRSMGE